MEKTDFDERLRCGVLRLEYDFAARHGSVYFPPLHCCDMTGCIKLFKGIDSECSSIQTFEANKPETVYMIDDDGNWIAKTYRVMR